MHQLAINLDAIPFQVVDSLSHELSEPVSEGVQEIGIECNCMQLQLTMIDIDND